MPRSPEDSYIASLDREGNAVEGVHYVNNEAFNTKVAAVWNRVRPRLREFSYFNLEDPKLVQQIEHGSRYVHERADAAVGLEYVMMQGIHEAGWLGDGAAVTPTSKYDDVVNHLDAVIAIRAGGEPMYLGLDVTSSGTYEIIERKLQQTADLLLKGELATAKYYIDDETNERKQVRVPRVVIAASPHTTAELMEQMVEHPAEAAGNAVQLEVLDEVLEQLQFGLDVLQQRGAPATTQEVYRRLIAHLAGVRKEKGLSVQGEHDETQRDIISEVIKRQRRFLEAA